MRRVGGGGWRADETENMIHRKNLKQDRIKKVNTISCNLTNNQASMSLGEGALNTAQINIDCFLMDYSDFVFVYASSSFTIPIH